MTSASIISPLADLTEAAYINFEGVGLTDVSGKKFKSECFGVKRQITTCSRISRVCRINGKGRQQRRAKVAAA